MPHRLRTVYHYKVSNDVLHTILEYLDPSTLWRACMAIPRIYALVMEYQSLRYKLELAVSGMLDGPASHGRAPAYLRLQLLLSCRNDWSTLQWTHEHKTQIPLPAQLGFSSGFLHHIKCHGTFNTLDLAELPSCRTNRPPSHTRHLRYTTPAIENVAIDANQGLLVTSHIFSHAGQVGVQIHFRDLWTFGKHPRVPAVSSDFMTQIAIRVSRIAIVICGTKLAVSMEFVGGRIVHMLIDWPTMESTLLDDQDIHFMNETSILAVGKTGAGPILRVYNITRVSSPIVVREYEFPPTWKNAVVGFAPNGSPRSDSSLPPDTLFYSAPDARVIVITARSTPSAPGQGHIRHPLCNWLVTKEVLFRYMPRKTGSRVAWNQWAQCCLIKDLSEFPLVRTPYVLGTRVVYLESGINYPGRQPLPVQLHSIEFPPFSDGSTRTISKWMWNGTNAQLAPVEGHRPIPPTSTNGLNVEDIRLTEDNIVLFLETQGGHRLINVLTFGVPARRA